MPIEYTFENGILKIDFSGLSPEIVAVLKEMIGYQEEIPNPNFISLEETPDEEPMIPNLPYYVCLYLKGSEIWRCQAEELIYAKGSILLRQQAKALVNGM